MKSKFDYEIEEFEQAFGDKKEKKIAIYGTGRMTATLLTKLKGFQIVGLLDRDDQLIGKKLYGGIEIISREKAERIADIIVINTAENYWNTIYNRIKTWKIPVYFRNGELAKGNKREDNVEDEYWNSSYSELEKKAADYKIVSFDVFDTLLLRKVFLSSDVFCLVEKKIQSVMGRCIHFTEIRRQAVTLLEHATLDEIYLKIQELTGWDDTLANEIKQFEWNTDLKLITAREDMVTLCRRLMAEKEVYFVSDMYYPAGLLKQILHKVGIETSEDRIFVSCDYKKSKDSGKLWEYFLQEISNGNKILHIGDSKKADFIVPQNYGIDTYLVRSAYEMLVHSSLKEIVPEIKSLAGSLAVGLIQADICNSPFALNEKRGIITFKNEKEAGYCLMGNFCYSFLKWLAKNAVADGVEEIIFLAREGYLLIEEYQYLCDLLKEEQLPRAVYLEISRRAIMNASIEKKEDIYETASFPYTGNLKEFLWDRFRVDTSDENAALMEATEIQKEKQTLESSLDKYIDQIYEKAQEERNNYLRYLSGLELKSKAGLVDSMLYGNTQHYLEKLRKKVCRDIIFVLVMNVFATRV